MPTFRTALQNDGGGLAFPSWGRAFWQDPNDGEIILLFASGYYEVNYITSADSGNTWTAPQLAFHVDDFRTHNNFDSEMDRAGNVHCVHRFADSGCYTFLGKEFDTGGWTPSGIVDRGFVTAGDSDQAKGFNGSLSVFDAALAQPSARIAAKDSSNVVNAWYVPNPFDSFPILDDVSAANAPNAGLNGGYSIFTDTAENGNPKILYSVEGTGIASIENPTGPGAGVGAWVYNQYKDVRINRTEEPSASNVSATGMVGNVHFGPNMAWENSRIGKIWPIITTMGTGILGTTDHQSAKRTNGFEFYATALESKSKAAEDYFGVVRASGRYTFGTRSRISGVVDYPFRSYPIGISGVMGCTPFMTGGMPVDISRDDSPDSILMYFQNFNAAGYPCISRTRCHVQKQDLCSTATIFTFSNPDVWESGRMDYADATLSMAGGSGLNIHWQKFKALHHPTAGGVGVTKQNIVATIGSGVDIGGVFSNTTNIYTWKFNESLVGTSGLYPPVYIRDWMESSGNNFVGVIDTNLAAEQARRIFAAADQSQTATQMHNRYITIEFERPTPITGMEQTIRRTSGSATRIPWHAVSIDASLDNINWQRVYYRHGDEQDAQNISGLRWRIIKATNEYDGVHVNEPFKPFVAKYLKVTWDESTGIATQFGLNQVRFLGGEGTNGSWNEFGLVDDAFALSKVFTASRARTLGPTTERFTGVTPPGLPSGWTTSGDWDWFTETGNVSSGVFSGQTIGSGDSTAVRTTRNTPPSTSGVLEIDVLVGGDENKSNGEIGRDISFDIRYDLTGIGIFSSGFPPVYDPEDDRIQFFVETSGVTTELYQFWTQPAWFLSYAPYYTVRTSLPGGTSTLRWVYTRGNLDVGDTSAESAAWIDNIVGVGFTTYPQTSIMGYMSAITENLNESVYAYMSGGSEVITGSVNSWMNADGHAGTGNFYGYLRAIPLASGSINSYMNAWPTHYINAYMSGFIDKSASSINGYVLNSGALNSIYGHLQNALNESIYGYVKGPDGDFNSIYAYMFTPEFASVYGYVKGPLQATGVIYGYLAANGNQDSIYGYLQGSGLPSNQIYCYMNAPGNSNNILGFAPRADYNNIYGYLQGHDMASGVIYSWMSGVGSAIDSVYGYLAGISGTASGSINGWMSAVELPSANLHGFLIGFDDESACDFPVPNHPYVSWPTGACVNE